MRSKSKRTIGFDETIKFRAIKIKIYPDEKQEIIFDRTFGCCRWLWNHMLDDVEDYYDSTDKFQVPVYSFYKRHNKFLHSIDCMALSNTRIAIEKAYRDFFNNPEIYKKPKYRTKQDYKMSYTTNKIDGKNNVALVHRGIKLPKVGIVRADIYRTPQKGWKLKSCTITKSKSSNYYCSLRYEIVEKRCESKSIANEDTTLGLDFSIPHLYVDSKGESPTGIHWQKISEQKIAKMNRKLSRMQYGSNNYKEQLRKIQSIYEHTKNQRKDFLHKKSRELANAYYYICIENINLQEMAKVMRFGKCITDNSFGIFRSLLKYKLEEEGKNLVVVNKWFPSSRICNTCGYKKNDLKLNERIWTCPKCGEYINRDYNAAKNIRDEGIKIICQQSLCREDHR